MNNHWDDDEFLRQIWAVNEIGEPASRVRLQLIDVPRELVEFEHDLEPRSNEALDSAERALQAARHLGAAARSSVLEEFRHALPWAQRKHDPSRGSYDDFTRALLVTVLRRFTGRYTKARLWRERRDEDHRNAAAAVAEAFVSYWDEWEDRLRRLQLAHPRVWRVPGYTPDELRDELMVQLAERLKQDRLAEFERPGAEATFVFLAKRKDDLRRHRRIYEAVPGGDLGDLVSIAPTPEEEYLRRAGEVQAAAAIKRAEEELSRLQRQWLAAFRADVNWRGGKLNLSRAAEQLGRNRSTAHRAKQEIEAAFTQAGLREFL